MTTYQTEDGRRVTIPPNEPDALGAFLAACAGPDPDVSALDWLGAILTEVESDPLFTNASVDQPATRHALAASRRLLEELRAAVKLAQ